MRKVSDTITRFAAMRGERVFSQGPDRLSDLADFGANPGALRARFFAPENLPIGAPLVVVLHGCSQSAAGYDHGSGWSRLAAEEGFAVLFPEQQRANNPHLCFNWFVPGDVTRDRGEVFSICQMIEAIVMKHGLDRSRIFITGLSAGGAMANAMLATYPELFAGGAIIAGLPYGSASTIPEAFDRMRGYGGPSSSELQQRLVEASRHQGTWPRISVWHGAADNTVAPSNTDSIIAQWQGVHGVNADPTRGETVDGHIRQVWCDSTGHELLEKYTVASMGHGTPLKTGGTDGLGNTAPFMREVGISSTRRIADFWGLTNGHATKYSKLETGSGRSDGAKALCTYSASENARAVRTDKEERPRDRSRRPEADIGKTIEDALRAAGLMR
ncbi:MAG TPA: PHB depolymerase family esterase [Mesorhizobium sp.]|uniref:extracellular catalytic domain type 1 short-chain-length polyhydroxyalkanoate depolymerase n=1 Tax=Mesorhizobium sp. TaxID=1871066 RepID=UPI002DDCADE0|nr:PHB depolymerase family esterase [Mesorhizobium sp.]HEV2505156.1 PHB depolymerase family esterase [Mesorhizobium sp.]